MTQVNIPNINDGDNADDSLWNSRFGALASVINGNLGSDNIQDGSLTYSKLNITDGAIPQSKMPFPVTLGSNGGTAGGTMNSFVLGELLVYWGTTDVYSVSAGTTTDKMLTFPSAFAANPTLVAMARENTVHAGMIFYQASGTTTTTGRLVCLNNSGSTATAKADWIAIGKKGS